MNTSTPTPTSPDQPDAPQPGLRERKKQQTHQALQAAAQRLVAERGFDHVSIGEIAAAANVSKRTFSNHFPSKEAAIVDPPPQMMARFAAELAARPYDEPLLDGVHAVQVASFTADFDDVATRVRLIRASPALQQRYAIAAAAFGNLVRGWVAARTGEPDTALHPVLIAALCDTVTRVAITRWDPDTPISHLTDLITEIYTLLAHVATPKPT